MLNQPEEEIRSQETLRMTYLFLGQFLVMDCNTHPPTLQKQFNTGHALELSIYKQLNHCRIKDVSSLIRKRRS